MSARGSECIGVWMGTCSCRKLRLIFTNQYKAKRVAKTLMEPMLSERANNTRMICWVLSGAVVSCRAASSGFSGLSAPLEI